ncbi:MAG: bifunctional tetrahydrofolate synthase/dihydrofolate synthase [Cocleimonas sp.]|nr:bifunctional tetrahydrofolate synthase/dihydrofolate synthase [Cocleimonas sp.]
MKKTLAEWLSWQETLHLSEIDLGLDRIREVAKKLDLLSPTFPIITVAGTNGKGSTVALFESILNAQGYKTGSYTSPHLIDYNERIKLNTINAKDDLIVEAFEEINKARGNTSLTYFEFGTLAAMIIFYQQKVDVAILEVGLGGRLDASNLWDTSLAIITNIGIDHVDWLGDDREVIAVEKAGIMRKGIPAVCGDLDPPDNIANEAQRISANLYQINHHFSYQENNDETWTWKGFSKNHTLPLPALAGKFQLNNAATVLAGLQLINSLLPTTQNSIKQGLKKISLTGRLQTIQHNPEWLIDVAHNPHAAKQLSKHLQAQPIKGKNIALFSMLKDKDIQQVVDIMDQHIDEWHIVELEGSRSSQLSELKELINKQNPDKAVVAHQSFSDAIKSIKTSSNLQDRVVAFGSFLVVSELIKLMRPSARGNSK